MESNRNKCLIQNLTFTDKVGMWASCIVLTLVSVVLSSFLIYTLFRSAYLLKSLWGSLLTDHPNPKYCIFVSICIFGFLFLAMFTYCAYRATLDRIMNTASGKAYKFIFLDPETDRPVDIRYETLEWLESQGYKLIYNGTSVDISNNEEE